jgi:hypothetical protein
MTDNPQRTYRPEEVAPALGVTGKVFRGWLRATFPRDPSVKGTTWVVTQEAFDAAKVYFAKRRTASTVTNGPEAFDAFAAAIVTPDSDTDEG